MRELFVAFTAIFVIVTTCFISSKNHEITDDEYQQLSEIIHNLDYTKQSDIKVFNTIVNALQDNNISAKEFSEIEKQSGK